MYSILLQSPAGGGVFNLVFFLILGLIFWFLVFKPQRDQQKKLESFRNSLSEGDTVLTNGGLYGKIKQINKDKILIEVAKDVVVTVNRYAINPIQEKEEAKDAKK